MVYGTGLNEAKPGVSVADVLRYVNVTGLTVSDSEPYQLYTVNNVCCYNFVGTNLIQQWLPLHSKCTSSSIQNESVSQ